MLKSIGSKLVVALAVALLAPASAGAQGYMDGAYYAPPAMSPGYGPPTDLNTDWNSAPPPGYAYAPPPGYGYVPPAAYGYAPRRAYGYAPRRAYGYAPRGAYGYGPRAYGYAPRGAYGYGPRAYGYAPPAAYGYGPPPAVYGYQGYRFVATPPSNPYYFGTEAWWNTQTRDTR